jgi:hypothetical protein
VNVNDSERDDTGAVEDWGIEPRVQMTPSVRDGTNRPPPTRFRHASHSTTTSGDTLANVAKRLIVPAIPYDFKEAVTRLLKVKPPARSTPKRVTTKRKKR